MTTPSAPGNDRRETTAASLRELAKEIYEWGWDDVDYKDVATALYAAADEIESLRRERDDFEQRLHAYQRGER